MKLNKNTTLKEIVKTYPQTIEVLNTLSIDYCCGGDDTIEKAVKENNGNLEEILSLLEEKSSEKNMDEGAVFSIDEFKILSINDMIDSLINTHHLRERELLSELDELINKILLVHYNSHKDQLVKVHHLFGTLKTELEEHFAKEEKVVFELIKNNPNPTEEIKSYIEEVESEHDVAGEILKELKVVTDNFTAPSDGCFSYNKTFEKLKELVNDVFVHVFKENSILFPEYFDLVK